MKYYQYTDLGRINLTIYPMLVLATIITIVGLVHGLYSWQWVTTQPSEVALNDLSSVTQNILLTDQNIRLTQISLTLFILTFFFVVWLYVARRNVDLFERPIESSLKQSIKDFARLFAGILFALRMMIALWRGSQPNTIAVQYSRRLVVMWWLILIIANVCKIIGVWQLLAVQNLAEWQASYPWMLAAYSFYLLLYLLTYHLIRQVACYQDIKVKEVLHLSLCDVVLETSGREEEGKIGPYAWGEGLRLIWRNLMGPSKKNLAQQNFIPQKTQLNLVHPQFKLAVAGDVMMMFGNELKISSEMKSFVADCDALLLNMEGVITDLPKKGPDQKHDAAIIEQLKQLFPANKTWLSFANNHSADFGSDVCHASYQQFQQTGFQCFGLQDQPYANLHPYVRVITATQWSNKVTDQLYWLDQQPEQFRLEHGFNLFYPHWGFEMECYPRPMLVQQMKQWLMQYQAVIGHHSHTPQPITQDAVRDQHIRQLAAYSMGDFCFGLAKKKWPGLKHYPYGLILKVEIGPCIHNEKEWAIGKVEWSFTDCEEQDDGHYLARLVQRIPYFRNHDVQKVEVD